jgi:hypothetical protein
LCPSFDFIPFVTLCLSFDVLAMKNQRIRKVQIPEKNMLRPFAWKDGRMGGRAPAPLLPSFHSSDNKACKEIFETCLLPL